ncbi:hypothetical protein N9164_16160 [Draconibacterium sp.]|nr:hypothetical protein [Draconibacterium sp.]
MASDEQFIHGICNYCNRWCERCSKTQQCISFAHDQLSNGIDLKQSNNDLENKKFWNAIEQFLKTDSNKLIQNASLNASSQIPVTHLAEFAEQYENSVNDWLTKNNTFFEEKNELVVGKYDGYNSIMFSDAIEILKWYSLFISKRILRSLKDLNERMNGNFKDSNNPFRDNLGSAKNTIVACNHSMAAFLLLYTELEKHQDKIQSFFTELIQIKSCMLEIFPEAMQFKRPGFDS